ncbi:hypothetical protein GQ457_02G021450 [Hibiscus cannabinus]
MSDQMKKMEKYYVLFHGKSAGIYRSWIECAHMIIGVKGSRFESFESESEAKETIDKYRGKEAEAKTDIKELSANILFAYILGFIIGVKRRKTYQVVAYVCKKLSRGGKRFGFVEFGSQDDAKRAMERLNGFSTYGFRLTVKAARESNLKKDGDLKRLLNEQQRDHSRNGKEEFFHRTDGQLQKMIVTQQENGKSGGLLVVWDINWFSMINVTKNQRFISITGKWSKLDTLVNLVNVYAPCTLADQEKVWDELSTLKANDGAKWGRKVEANFKFIVAIAGSMVNNQWGYGVHLYPIRVNFEPSL